MICVFDIGNSNYTGNGNAVLQPTECRISNKAGGNYDLSLTHPIDPEGKWTHLVPGAIIRAPVPEEEIENAYTGEAVDVYKTTAEAALREGPSEPTTITYPGWSQYNTYSVGSKVSSGGRNYECTYFDPNSVYRADSPGASSWWREIPRTTPGAAALVTLPAGTDLYFIEDHDTTWAKMSTPYGIVGYVKKAQIAYDRHLDPSETQPRVITTQLFRIDNPAVNSRNRTVTVSATHVSYDLNGILIQDVNVSQASPAMALGRITAGFMIPYPGTIATNLTSAGNGTYTQEIKGKNGMFALLDPDKGVVSTFDAALKRDNWDLFVMTKTETDRGFTIRYRKNMLGVNWSRDAGNLVTRVVPVAKNEGGEDLYLPEKWIDSVHISEYPVIRMERLGVKGQVGKDKGLGDDSTWTLEDLLDEMREKAEERFSVDKADVVKTTVTVDFEQMGDTAEYLPMNGMEKVLLYDTVTVINEEIGLSIKLTVSEWEWDAIRRKITAIKLENATGSRGGNVAGYSVQNNSITPAKLTDDVSSAIISEVKGLIPEYADPNASRPATIPEATDQALGGVKLGFTTAPNNGFFALMLSYGRAYTAIEPATQSQAGLMSKADKVKLDGMSALTAATDQALGGVKLGFTTAPNNGFFALLLSNDRAYTAIEPATQTQAGLLSKADKIKLDGLSNYSLPLAASGTRGGIQIGYTQSGKNYPVQLSGEKAYVYVPWSNTTYSAGSGLSLSGTTFSEKDWSYIQDYTVSSGTGSAYVSIPSGAKQIGASATDGAWVSPIIDVSIYNSKSNGWLSGGNIRQLYTTLYKNGSQFKMNINAIDGGGGWSGTVKLYSR